MQSGGGRASANASTILCSCLLHVHNRKASCNSATPALRVGLAHILHPFHDHIPGNVVVVTYQDCAREYVLIHLQRYAKITHFAEFLEAIRSIQPQDKWRDLVVDLFSRKLLFAVLDKKEVLGQKITGECVFDQHVLSAIDLVEGVEEISEYRSPQPNQEAMYLLMPTTQNVDRVIAEFSNGQKQHSIVHLFFIEGLVCDLTRKQDADCPCQVSRRISSIA